jgi:hypothetical protein
VLGDWYGDTNKKVASNKQGSMHANGFEDILGEFSPAFDCVKSLCRDVRTVLFSLTKGGKLDLRTPADLITLYDPFIKAFKDAIAGLDAGT